MRSALENLFAARVAAISRNIVVSTPWRQRAPGRRPLTLSPERPSLGKGFAWKASGALVERLEPDGRPCELRRMSETPSDALPDRLSVDPNSPYYDADILARNVGVRFKGQDKTNVEEYCVSEGWVRLTVGNSRDRHGNPLTVKLQGPVEPYFREG
jgi:hypothetical protein